MKTLLQYKSILENKQKIVRVAIIILLIFAALFLFLFRTENPSEKEIMKQNDSDSQTSVQSDISIEVIIVDVAGEVVNPSVIELPSSSRINDAIEAAGGLTKQADITQINRAALLSDGEKVYIPSKPIATTENQTLANGNEVPGNTNNIENTTKKLININYATGSELQELPGIGPVTSDKIIQYRREHGLFKKLDDIKKVNGIGEKTYSELKPFICI